MTSPAQSTTCFLERFDQSFAYPVWFTRGSFNQDNPSLLDSICQKNETSPKKLMIFIDQGLSHATPDLEGAILDWCSRHKDRLFLTGEPQVLPGGEPVKNTWDHVHEATRLMAEAAMDRHGCILALGGGAFLDMVGFAATIFHRGIKLVRMPSTTLAQNDAGIGVKNGINQFGQKNCIGTFAIPHAVVNDFDFLSTLPFDHFIGGVAEAFKIALIRDRQFFSFLETNSTLLKLRDPGAIEETIRQCARIHLEHISGSGDPFESGSSRPLDYGHWSAHKIEILSRGAISHGQAVSVGIALDSYYAWKTSLITENEFLRLLKALTACGLPVWNPCLELQDKKGRLEIENGLEEFRQHLGGRLTFTMPDGIGKACERHEMDFSIIRKGIAFLKKTCQN